MKGFVFVVCGGGDGGNVAFLSCSILMTCGFEPL